MTLFQNGQTSLPNKCMRSTVRRRTRILGFRLQSSRTVLLEHVQCPQGHTGEWNIHYYHPKSCIWRTRFSFISCIFSFYPIHFSILGFAVTSENEFCKHPLERVWCLHWEKLSCFCSMLMKSLLKFPKFVDFSIFEMHTFNVSFGFSAV